MISSDFSARWFMPISPGPRIIEGLAQLNCEVVTVPGVSGLVVDECPYGLGDLYWSQIADEFMALCEVTA